MQKNILKLINSTVIILVKHSENKTNTKKNPQITQQIK